MNIQSDKLLDAKGLSCPMPIVRTKKAIDELLSGQVLEIHTTDKGALKDLAAWANTTGNKLIHQEEEQDVQRFWIEKA